MTEDLHTRMRKAFAGIQPRRLSNGKTPRDMEILAARGRAAKFNDKLQKQKPWWRFWK